MRAARLCNSRLAIVELGNEKSVRTSVSEEERLRTLALYASAYMLI